MEWDYLEGDGDFRSAEVCALRDEADIIITNPPFSLFREFFVWVTEARKKFVIIGNQNAITYKEVFPLIKDNLMWLGKGFKGGATHFISNYEDVATAGNHIEGMIRVSGVVWFTNLDHGRRHQPLDLMTMEDNIMFSRHKEIKGVGYKKYDNYDALEIPYSDAIPSDYEGVMGVPVTFLDKYCPEQFEIIWRSEDIEWAENECSFYTPPSEERAQKFKKNNKTWRVQNVYVVDEQDNEHTVYKRIFIRKRKQQ